MGKIVKLPHKQADIINIFLDDTFMLEIEEHITPSGSISVFMKAHNAEVALKGLSNYINGNAKVTRIWENWG